MRFIYLLLLLSVSSTLVACAGGAVSDTKGEATGNSAQTERTMRMAERALAEGKPDMAAMFYRTAAIADPANPKPRAASAALFERAGEFAAAAGLYQQLARENSSTDYWLSAGRNFLKANQPADAANAYQQVLENSDKDARALNGLGVSYDLRQQHSVAQGWYEKAHAAADDKLREGILVNWALSLMLAGEAGQAVQKLAPAVENSNAPSLRQTLALAYGLAGKADKAKALGLNNPPTYDELRTAIRDYGMAGAAALTPSAAPVADVVTVPAKGQ